jgi:hypothetical protein
LIFLGFKIGQRWLEAVMQSWGSYFVPVPKGITEQELPHFKAIEYHKLENINIIIPYGVILRLPDSVSAV